MGLTRERAPSLVCKSCFSVLGTRSALAALQQIDPRTGMSRPLWGRKSSGRSRLNSTARSASREDPAATSCNGRPAKTA